MLYIVAKIVKNHNDWHILPNNLRGEGGYFIQNINKKRSPNLLSDNLIAMLGIKYGLFCPALCHLSEAAHLCLGAMLPAIV